jgi:hypothetical protein
MLKIVYGEGRGTLVFARAGLVETPEECKARVREERQHVLKACQPCTGVDDEAPLGRE